MDVGLDQSLVDIGVDSLMAMGLKKQVRAVLGVNVPLSAVLKGGTVRSLTELIMERLQEEQAAAAADAVVKNAETTSAEPADDLLAQLRQLPESEALALLEKESR
ncbi:MAG: acyl carrier protein [Tessaracoccus sp.]